MRNRSDRGARKRLRADKSAGNLLNGLLKSCERFGLTDTETPTTAAQLGRVADTGG